MAVSSGIANPPAPGADQSCWAFLRKSKLLSFFQGSYKNSVAAHFRDRKWLRSAPHSAWNTQLPMCHPQAPVTQNPTPRCTVANMPPSAAYRPPWHPMHLPSSEEHPTPPPLACYVTGCIHCLSWYSSCTEISNCYASSNSIIIISHYIILLKNVRPIYI